MIKIISPLLVSFLFVFSTSCYSQNEVKNLSPELSALLKQEMQAIELGMKNIISAFAAGDFEQVSDIAKKIQHSFILKQKLSVEQKHELHQKLPHSFIKKDQQFHQYAGMLAHVSEKKHAELVSFYYSRMMESCASCHREHATHQFSHFKKVNDHQNH